MPWLEELSEPLQLRRCIRDLVALSSLAALWRDYNSEQIADSVAAALLPMLDADLVYVSVFGRGGDHSIEVFRTAETLPRGRLESAQKLLRSARDTWNGEISIGANPSGGEAIRVVAARMGADRESFIAAGSVNSKFPTETHRLLFDTAANDTNIALQQWQVDAQQRCLITLIERSSEFIGFSDLSGQPLYVNAAARELLGISTLQKFQNITIFDLMAEDERPRARTKLMALVLETGRWTGELSLRHFLTGESIPFFFDWFRIDDARTGQALNMAAVGRDLRAQKRNEAALVDLNLSLEQRVGERTRELAQAIGRLTFEAAERSRADERAQELQLNLFHASRLSAAGQMMGALAHELTQPLTAFTNSVNAARRMLGNRGRHKVDTIREVLAEAADEALRAGEIMHRLREFVTRGETELRLEDLPSLLHQAHRLTMTGSAPEKVQVVLRLDPRAKIIWGNRIQLQQVIFNLMRNAIEAMSNSEHPKLRVETRKYNDGSTEITVADWGPGVPEEIREHLFEPFRTTKHDGMGLGLSICRTIAEAHGGRLEFEPNPGGGTIFRLTLPPQQSANNGR